MSRELHLDAALRSLVATIDLHTDCMTGLVDRSALDDDLAAAEQLLAEGWDADESHPANAVTAVRAIVFYPAGSLGEAVEDQSWQ